MMATKRLIRELAARRAIEQKGEAGELQSLGPINDSDLTHWHATFLGPQDTPFSRLFELDIIIPASYPTTPPTIKFKTQTIHPNINPKTGEICLDLLRRDGEGAWSPAWTIQTACEAVKRLLGDPVAESPLNVDVAHLIRIGDWLGYRSLVGLYVDLYARP